MGKDKHSKNVLKELRDEEVTVNPDEVVEDETVVVPKTEEEELKALFTPSVNSKAEKIIPEEWFNPNMYGSYTNEDLVHFYKCSLGRQKSYKASFLKEGYKKLAELLLKEIEKRKKASNNHTDVDSDDE